ncbi:MerR family transcriptional regulator [Mariniflexile sp. AS56]|uniref:MerR family transcriptional regulator n=1 Tax=Mariniflexile sp. AS56 TaxID=3063957 RepID=UPI0026ED7C1A|nr:MerR family transcriptional regulator [Mariniflexile sp. AS56]MDO7171525.1 MerR family transcriptional regulator [Mariniflexile sp. AS56]
MNNIKSTFSIKDLENLSGIKAHTIRIWEKRYNLLSPNRTDTNIRHYSIPSLQKLLNIAYLNNNGYKISKIANFTEEEIPLLVKEIAIKSNPENFAINDFKLAMFNFDEGLFKTTFNTIIKTKSFTDIVYTVFFPLLNDIGLLWQTNTITPAHEHFLAVLIKQKILLQIELLENVAPHPSTKTFVLFLPEYEIHEIGLLFINYQLKEKGFHTIFLGESVPKKNLKDIFNFYSNIYFISYFTIYPEEENISSYIEDFNHLLLKDSNSKLWLFGQKLVNYTNLELPENITIYKSLENFVKDL